ncbi:MAG: hypothetical protein GDA55_01885 [Cellvibrionales bacterium]|nr:hypothetical protein [Cellvibrionales bacterium]
MKLDDAPVSRVIVDFDKLGLPFKPNALRCDYLFVSDGTPGWVVPMELSSGKNKSTQTINQIQAGAKIADELLPSGIKIKFQPVFVGRVSNFYLRQELNKRKIRFRNECQLVKTISCGDKLTKALK